MTLFKLVLYIGIAALILTLLVGFLLKKHKSWPMTFLQNFCGVLFVFSGAVKAIDPLGTAYKMEQYFAEFENTFSGTSIKFLAPMFPWLAEHSATFSVVMIIFEIVLGLMLIMGSRTKFTAWAFLVLVAFFTVLTGFTYLTGYVPQGVNFFEFGKWGAYVSTNMKVTDCGCFGDFLKLEPKVSFLKDVVLLVPALFFVFRHRDMHQLFTARFRTALTWVCIFGLTVFCLNNFVWNEPVVDFRPFFNGQHLRDQRQAELDAAANVEILAYKATNKASRKVVEIPYEQYMKEYKNYPKEEWELDQIRSEPAIKATKLSEFDLSNPQGEEGTEEVLNDANYNFLIVSYKLPGTSVSSTVTVQDTSWIVDTIRTEGKPDSLVNRVESVQPMEIKRETFTFDTDFQKRFSAVVNPVAEAAQKEGFNVRCVTAPADPAKIDDFRHATQSAYPFFTADDILLKTIIRSNPGILLLKDGKIIHKWHWRQLPTYDQIKAKYMQ